MCGCEAHWDGSKLCSCDCPIHDDRVKSPAARSDRRRRRGK